MRATLVSGAVFGQGAHSITPRRNAGSLSCDVGHKPTADGLGFVVHCTVERGARVGERGRLCMLERSHSPGVGKELLGFSYFALGKRVASCDKQVPVFGVPSPTPPPCSVSPPL